jgi:alkaline phosphatase D
MHLSRRQFLKASAAGLGALAADGLARAVPGTGSPPPPPADFTRVAFGSCLHDSADAACLATVLKAAPQAFVWLGDTIYGDTDDMAVLRARYQALADNPRFKALKAACPQLGIWDDHDYGRNNAGREYPWRRDSQRIFLDFYGVPAGDPRRTREGTYHSQVFGTGNRTVQFILLDGRYHRTTDKADPGGTMLGEAQWKWLEDQLKVPAVLRIVCSGIQVVPDEHGFEGWHEFPKEKQRLYDLIKDTRTPGVIFVSGDQHWAELSREEAALGYPAYDLTASALDQTWPLPVNRRRLGAATPDANFGMIEMDWDRPDPVVHFKILAAADGKVILDRPVALSTLYPWGPVAARPRARKESSPVERGAVGAPGPVLRGRDLAGRKRPER